MSQIFPTVTIPHHNQLTKIEISSQPTINAIAVLQATSGGNIVGQQLSKCTHTTVAMASTVDYELSLTRVADRSFVNHKFLCSPGSRHDIDSVKWSNHSHTTFLLTNFKNTFQKPESTERCENESRSEQTFAHSCRF